MTSSESSSSGVEEAELVGAERERAPVADGDLLFGVDLGHQRAGASVVEEDERLVTHRLDQADRRGRGVYAVPEPHVLWPDTEGRRATGRRARRGQGRAEPGGAKAERVPIRHHLAVEEV